MTLRVQLATQEPWLLVRRHCVFEKTPVHPGSWVYVVAVMTEFSNKLDIWIWRLSLASFLIIVFR